jgi:hypothetical protein
VNKDQRDGVFSRLVVDRETGCLLWTGAKDGSGYGYVTIRRRKHRVHRLMYELFVGEIPEGMELDHVKARGCANRHCASPAHLEAVTHAENLNRREVPSRKGVATHCKAGHEFDLLNTYYRTNGNRRCRACDRERELNRPPRKWVPRPRKTPGQVTP